MSHRFVFTSESVTEGHPDKVADGISDVILDRHIEGDPGSRVACEVLVSTGMVVVAGEITSNAMVPYADVVRDKIRRIGYTDPRMGFSYDTCTVLVALDKQSPDIARGVTPKKGKKEQGAGDQGMMFGFACKDTPELMPAPIMLAHRLTRRLAEVRRKGILKFLRPDGKSQVSVLYENGKPVSVETVVVSTQHEPDVSYNTLRDAVIEEVVKRVIPANLLKRTTRYFVNPTGRFVIGGPQADSGLTGRKIIVDTYGGMARHGGGSFSGKDPSKVDRSATYMMRYISKNIVAAGLADKCELQVAYAIGRAEPVSICIETFGTGKVPHEKLESAVLKVFDLRPAAIIEELDLLRPIYEKTSAYGHFGHNTELDVFTWERTDKVEKLKSAVSA
jgi:S-adenosylmethionine synthetase